MVAIMPGVFFRLVVIACLSKIIRNFERFVTMLTNILPLEIKIQNFEDLDRIGEMIDVNSLNLVVPIIKSQKWWFINNCCYNLEDYIVEISVISIKKSKNRDK